MMFAVIKAAGAKGVKKVQDVMRLPMIDSASNVDPAVTARLRKRLDAFKKEQHGRTGT